MSSARKLLILIAPLALLLGGCSSNGLRLETYNIAHLTYGPQKSVNAKLGDVASDIAATNADVVALQETKQTGATPDAQTIVHDLGWDSDGQNHVFFAGWHDPNANTNWCNGTSCTEGNAIISRFPVKNGGSTPLYFESGGLHRNLIWADIQIGAALARVYSTHLAHDDEPYAAKQLNGALLFINQHYPQNEPVVLMGDLNIPLTASTYGGAFGALRSSGFSDWKTDRVHEVDPGFSSICNDSNQRGAIAPCTYPSPSPTQKYDYIWVRGFKPNAGLVWNNCTSGCTSDHRPYWTDIGG